MKIVVGGHDTVEGRVALERAAALAHEQGAELHLVSVVSLPLDADAGSTYEKKRETRLRELETIAAPYRDRGIVCRAHVPIALQRPADALVSVAKIEKADLIVIGMRRRSRVSKLVLGSTAQEVLLDADCDVLSVKAPKGVD